MHIHASACPSVRMYVCLVVCMYIQLSAPTYVFLSVLRDVCCKKSQRHPLGSHFSSRAKSVRLRGRSFLYPRPPLSSPQWLGFSPLLFLTFQTWPMSAATGSVRCRSGSGLPSQRNWTEDQHRQDLCLRHRNQQVTSAVRSTSYNCSLLLGAD